MTRRTSVSSSLPFPLTQAVALTHVLMAPDRVPQSFGLNSSIPEDLEEAIFP